MPDLLTRKEHEDECALIILLFLQQAEDDYRNSGAVDWLLWTAQLSRELVPALMATFLESAEQLAGEFAGTLVDAVERARQWATNQANWLAAALATATQNAMAAAMASSGKTAAEVASEVEHVFSEARAEAGGITETTGAITEGEVFASQELQRLGIFLFPYWVTERDSRVCPVCRPLDGRPREEWWSEHGSGPPAHPGCRCTLEWREEK